MTTLNTRDPVQGLVDYVNDVKPFHSKILEVWVEYIHTDPIKSVVADNMFMELSMNIDRTSMACKFGFDSQPWNDLISDVDVSEVVVGEIDVGNGITVSKAIAYRQFYEYNLAVWKWKNGLAMEPTISVDPTSQYYWMNFDVVRDSARLYFSDLANGNEYWFEPAHQKVYKKIGLEWHEQPAYVSTVQPQYPEEQDLWFSTHISTLYILIDGTWEEIRSVAISYNTPSNNPFEYPPEWWSNWDAPACLPPFGDTSIYTYVKDQLEITHGSEIFLSDSIRAMVYDPTGDNTTLSTIPGLFTQRTEYPITYRTIVTQDASGRYKIERQEVSIITEPNNPDVINHPYTIHLDGMEFEGFGLERDRKGVRLNEFLVWKHTKPPVGQDLGMQLLADTVMNKVTFGFRVDGDSLIAQRFTPNGLEDIDCPFAANQVVYFSSPNGDLPEYRLLTQESRVIKVPVTKIIPDPDRPGLVKQVVEWEERDRNVPLLPYVPYRIYKIDARRFSVVLLKQKSQYLPDGTKDPQMDFSRTGGSRAGNTPYEVDDVLMGGSACVEFVTPGSGDLFFGMGYPVPFIEMRMHHADAATTTVGDLASSPSEAFPSVSRVAIMDVLIGYDDGSGIGNGFVVPTTEYKFIPGEVITVSGSTAAVNDGDWIVVRSKVWTNEWEIVNGSLVPSATPIWWNEAKLGTWPQPVKKSQNEIAALIRNGMYVDQRDEYDYFSVTTVNVAGSAPSLQFPHGHVLIKGIALSEPVYDQNAAVTTIQETFSIQVI